MGWPLLFPILLVVLASYYMIAASFVEPGLEAAKRAELVDSGSPHSTTLWEREDGRIGRTCGSKRLTLLGYILTDIFAMLPIVMPIYGVLPALLSYWNCLVRGNRFNFVSASKGVACPPAPAPPVSVCTCAEHTQPPAVSLGQPEHAAQQSDDVV